MDKHLDQTVQHQTTIGCIVTKSYMIYSVHDAIKTLALFLAFLTNLANWKPIIGAQELKKSDLYTFLENTIASLTSRQGRSW